MFFSKHWKDERLDVIIGCLLAALIFGAIATFVAGFWVGWFNLAATLFFARVSLILFAVCFVCAVFGLSEYFAIWKAALNSVSPDEDYDDCY